MDNTRRTLCGCCAHGCRCRDHAADHREVVCDYHLIQDRLTQQMRDVFISDVREDRT